MRATTSSGIVLDVTGSYDGIGANDYSAYTGWGGAAAAVELGCGCREWGVLFAPPIEKGRALFGTTVLRTGQESATGHSRHLTPPTVSGAATPDPALPSRRYLSYRDHPNGHQPLRGLMPFRCRSSAASKSRLLPNRASR